MILLSLTDSYAKVHVYVHILETLVILRWIIH